MKQIISLLLALIMLLCLAGCSPAPISPEPDLEPTPEPAPIIQEPQETPEPQKEPFVFTRENFPKLDGSTSTVPLAQAMAAVLLSEPQEQVENLIEFSRTTDSYRKLIYQNNYRLIQYDFSDPPPDLLLAAEPAESIWTEKAEKGLDWYMEPFAIDGLIFVVNEDNPVDSLTVEQVQKIYTGEISNWSQVGGDDVEIIPFQRNKEAGSQTMMKKLVMGELPMMEPPMEYRAESMSTLIDAVREYEDSTGAIGYSVYYYANDMRMAEGLKILQIDGVAPGADSFRDKSYPFTNPYYVVMRTDHDKDDPTTILFNWILSEEGQRLVDHLGYVAVQPPDKGPAVETAVPPVYANWAILEDTYAATGTYPLYWPEPKTELIPHDDYGLLTPFYGKIFRTNNYEFPLFGLATLDGKAVVEPIYSDARSLYWNDQVLPVFMLQQIIADEAKIATERQNGKWLNSEILEYLYDFEEKTAAGTQPGGLLGREVLEYLYGLAAADGSWYIPPEYAYAAAISPDRVLLVDTDGKFWLCDLDGTIEESPVTENAETILGESWREDLIENTWHYHFVNGLLTTTLHDDEAEEPQQMQVDFQTGEITYTPYIPDEGDNYVDLSIREDIVDPNTGLILRQADDSSNVGVYDPATETWVIESLEYEDMHFIHDTITNETYIRTFSSLNDYDIIFSSTGEPLFKTNDYLILPPTNRIFTVYDGYWSGLVDKDGNWIMRFVIPSNND